MTLDTTIIRKLRAFENEQVVPLVTELKATAIRGSKFRLVLVPNSLAFLANNSNAYELVDGSIYWQPLTVFYCDSNDQKGEVFRFRGCHDGQGTRLVAAEIVGCTKCVVVGGTIEMRNPIDDSLLLTFPTPDPSGLIQNVWYVFRGAILPLLYQGEYRFVQTIPDRVRFQAQMMHQIRVAYSEVM